MYVVGWQIAETFRAHGAAGVGEAHTRAVELLGRVGIPDPARRAGDYPHQFSGGQRQRVMIAMALALDPKVLIADEPTTALDVTVQAQIMDLLMELKAERGMALVLITHDLGVVAEMAEDVVVMYAGRVVESGPVRDIFNHPSHPYTHALLQSVPSMDERPQRLYAIEGQPPALWDLPPGCRFAPRCPHVDTRCLEAYPPFFANGDDHIASCWRLESTWKETPSFMLST